MAYIASVLTMVGSTVALTAVSLALGSVVPPAIQPQVPLPTTSILSPEPEPVKNVSEPMKTCEENCQTSASKNSLLSQLFAVIALPETLVHLIYGTQKKIVSHETYSNTEMPQQLLCANGPCTFSANKNCQNVSSGSSVQSVWDRVSTSLDCNCRNSGKQDKCRSHCNCDKDREHDLSWNHVKCCCTSKGFEVLSPDGHWSLHDRFSDISLGFRTGPRLPVLVQT